jgi:hypothetical protein
VHEVDLMTNGTVRGFRASFNQQCQGRPQILSGGVRVVNAPRTSADSVCYTQIPLALPPSTQPTHLRFASMLGDFIGRGQTRLFEPPDSRFRGQMVNDNRRLELWLQFGNEAWFLDVSAPAGQQLRPGRYVNAPSGSTAGLAFSFSGDGRGCTGGVSDFEVLEAVYARPPAGSSMLVSGIVERFRATFTQRCSGPTSQPLYGDVTLRDVMPNRCATPSGSC